MNLQNQSNEVMTYVETFLSNEIVELIYDNEQLEKWNKIVEELGLKGQSQILEKEKSPVPFLHMKQTLVKTFEELCPCKVNYKEYCIAPIPLEILDLISLSVNEKYFDKIEIWYDDKTPDPVAVGFRYDTEEHRKAGYSWYMEKYLIGKWGDVKRPFSELITLAKERFLVRKKHEYSNQIKNYTRKLEDLENEAYNEFGDQTSNSTLQF